MAYRSMAAAYGNMGDLGKKRDYLQKALELIHRTSERERCIIQGDFYMMSEETYDKAIEACKRLLEL